MITLCLFKIIADLCIGFKAYGQFNEGEQGWPTSKRVRAAFLTVTPRGATSN